jgi:hypothetical protein
MTPSTPFEMHHFIVFSLFIVHKNTDRFASRMSFKKALPQGPTIICCSMLNDTLPLDAAQNSLAWGMLKPINTIGKVGRYVSHRGIYLVWLCQSYVGVGILIVFVDLLPSTQEVSALPKVSTRV